MNILLMGARGSGKTTIGRLLAPRISFAFVDLDDVALACFEQRTIRAAWDEHGEAAWRAAESRALAAALERDRQVLAMGGGTPMIPAARKAILDAKAARGAWLVYLRCAVDELCRRLQEIPGDRPPLSGLSLRDEIAQTLTQRHAVYEELADVVCDASIRAPQEIAAEIAIKLAAQAQRQRDATT